MRRRFRRVGGMLACACVLASPPLTAHEAAGAPVGQTGRLAQLGLETWTPASGLAGSWVRAIVQGSDGFLWVGTSAGLSRFDGRRFVNFTAASEPELPSNSVAALAASSGGGLWIGLEHGGVRRLDNGHVHRDARFDALPAASVRSLVETADGTLWIGTASGLWRWRPGVGLEVVAPDVAARRATVARLRAAPDGSLWVRTREHGLWRVHGDVLVVNEDAPGCVGLDFAAAADGRHFTACVEGIWERRSTGESWREIAAVRSSQRLLLDREGALWYGDDAGLARRSADRVETLPVAVGLGDTRTRAFYEDDSGELWIGTFSRGLARLRRGAVTAVGAPEGVAITGTTAVVGRSDGSLWLGSNDDGVALWVPGAGVVRRWLEADGLPSDQVWAIAQDRQRLDHAWFGTSRGLVELDGGALRRIQRPGVPAESVVATLYADPLASDTVWVSGRSGGAEELRGSRTVRHDAQNGLDLGVVRFFHRNVKGVLLAGGEDGLYSFDGGRWHAVLLGGQEVRALRAICEEADGTLWLASESAGLLRWSDGVLVHLGPRDGLPFNLIHSLELDGQGGLWMSGDEGLLRIRLADFERWARGELDGVPSELFSARDGLRDRECNGWGSPSSSRFADGKLVYPTISGFALVEPARVVSPELTASELVIDAAWSGERELEVGAPIRLSRQERQLQVRFTALEFLRPEAVSFRYRLEGLDSDWQPAGQQRAAVYSHLEPGQYRFRLQARLPGRIWVEAARQLEVAVAPRIWEADWFRALAVSLVLLALAAFFHWRVRKERELRAKQAELRQLASRLIRAQEDERRRLAREIHDDLTQRLAGLGMLAGGLARSVHQGRAENVGARVEELGRELEHLASDAQVLARDLHPALLENLGLEAALRSECATFGERTGLRVLFDSCDLPEKLAPEVSLALYRITQEALRNVLSHAPSSEARVALYHLDGELFLAIEDTGPGFDPAKLSGKAGMGLTSMAERARLIGSRLELDTAPGRGTRIVVRVPLGSAS